eukprot:3718561-Heterocapsa_arctica.AAC.1
MDVDICRRGGGHYRLATECLRGARRTTAADTTLRRAKMGTYALQRINLGQTHNLRDPETKSEGSDP